MRSSDAVWPLVDDISEFIHSDITATQNDDHFLISVTRCSLQIARQSNTGSTFNNLAKENDNCETCLCVRVLG